ncbi:hypothetical protein JCM10213_006472, partial [Rhodosporidiobolus nylandii]
GVAPTSPSWPTAADEAFSDEPSSDDQTGVGQNDSADGQGDASSGLDPSSSNSTDAAADPSTAAIDPSSPDSTNSAEDPSTAEVDPSTLNSTNSAAAADGTDDADQAVPTFDLNAFTADSDFQTDGAGAAQPAATPRS